jgi:hypothetical protein
MSTNCDLAIFRTDGAREKINFVLQFKGQQDETLQEYIFGILIEIAPRTTVNGQISIVVGPLAVYEQSLAIEQATVAVATTALPIGNMGAGTISMRPDSKFLLSKVPMFIRCNFLLKNQREIRRVQKFYLYKG